MAGVPAVPPVTVGGVESPGRTGFSTLFKSGPAQGGKASRSAAASLVVHGAPPVVAHAIDRLALAQSRMEMVLRLAASGRSFSPAELLALQAGVAQASQVIDLSSRLVERSTSAMKQVLQTGA
jgi:hypothetical protein